MPALSRAPSRQPAARSLDPAVREPDRQDRIGNAAIAEDVAASPAETTPGLLLGGVVDSAFLDSAGEITGIPLGQYASGAPDLEDLFAASPSLRAALEVAQAEGWILCEGVAGEGTFSDPARKEIRIDPLDARHPAAIASSLAHELGHVAYQEPYVEMGTLDKETWVRENVMRHLRDEAEATVLELEARDEVLASHPEVDIGITGATADEKEALWRSYLAGGMTRDELVFELCVLFALGERPSTSPDQSYEDYYSEPYEDHWDASHR